MKNIQRVCIAWVVGLATLCATIVLAKPEIGSEFKRLWDRQDLPVQQQLTDRSWTWGPTVSQVLLEELVQGVNGQRRVQYFEKSRMEVNDPNADPNSLWFITNGLLPIEMMTGKIQTGYDFGREFKMRGPARISVIGDPGNYPTYADLLPIYENPGHLDPTSLNKPVTRLLNADGSVTEFNDYTSDANTLLVLGENGHGVAQAFHNFMNQDGVVYEGGQLVRRAIYSPPIFVFGKPVTKPYWVKAKVGGSEKPILFQVFERRVLTYNPANPMAFRVEMGNVGLHYYEWRYGSNQPATPTNTPAPQPTDTPKPAYP